MNTPTFPDPLLNDANQMMEEFFSSADESAIEKLLNDINYDFYSSLPDSEWDKSLGKEISIPSE